MSQMGIGIAEPHIWIDDGTNRREPVIDQNDNPSRIVRYVGWQPCLKCRKRYFSRDCRSIRLCDPCKNGQPQQTLTAEQRERDNRKRREQARMNR